MQIKLYKTLKNAYEKYREIEENNIDYENAKTILKNDKKAILVDVRSEQEYKEGHLEASINYPLYDIERKSELILNKKESTIILYCQSGSRSKKALKILKGRGYTSLYQIEGGLDNIN